MRRAAEDTIRFVARTWITTGLPENYEATKAHGFTGIVDISRLRPGEVASGIGAGLLLVWSGRRELPVTRWLALITGFSALALPCAQATRHAPALPVALSVVVTTLGGATAIGLSHRVLVRRAATASPPGAYVGLLGALGIATGGFASMRQESGTDPATLGELETIRLEP